MEWCTSLENSQHAWHNQEFLKLQRIPDDIYDHIGQLLQEGRSVNEIAEITNLQAPTIARIAEKSSPRAKKLYEKYHWLTLNDKLRLRASEVLELYASGCSVKEISYKTNISILYLKRILSGKICLDLYSQFESRILAVWGNNNIRYTYLAATSRRVLKRVETLAQQLPFLICCPETGAEFLCKDLNDISRTIKIPRREIRECLNTNIWSIGDWNIEIAPETYWDFFQ